MYLMPKSSDGAPWPPWSSKYFEKKRYEMPKYRTYPGDLADPKDVAAWMAWVAENEYSLPGVLPVMTSVVELASAWTGPGDVKDVAGYLEPVDHCSVGYFQQQADDLGCGIFGWGTRDQLIEASYALKRFCEEAAKLRDWEWNANTFDPGQLGRWCQAVQRSAYPDRYRDRGYPMALNLIEAAPKTGGEMPTGKDIVVSARKLLGASYRMWASGATVPMWLYDGYGDPPSANYIVNGPGVMCSDLVNWAIEDNGLYAIGGTGAWAQAMVEWVDFDPDQPGEPGAIAVKDYTGPYYQGHIAIYIDEHTLIQSLITPGVVEDYTDAATWGWGGETQFQWYGKIPGVSYESGDTSGPIVPESTAWIAWGADGKATVNGSDISRGWRWVADL
jgi:hypothetical protein